MDSFKFIKKLLINKIIINKKYYRCNNKNSI